VLITQPCARSLFGCSGQLWKHTLGSSLPTLWRVRFQLTRSHLKKEEEKNKENNNNNNNNKQTENRTRSWAFMQNQQSE